MGRSRGFRVEGVSSVWNEWAGSTLLLHAHPAPLAAAVGRRPQDIACGSMVIQAGLKDAYVPLAPRSSASLSHKQAVVEGAERVDMGGVPI